MVVSVEKSDIDTILTAFREAIGEIEPYTIAFYLGYSKDSRQTDNIIKVYNKLTEITKEA